MEIGICAHCQRKIGWDEGATFFEGRRYHRACLLDIIGGRLTNLEKKDNNGSITKAEQEELADYRKIRKNIGGI